MFSQEPPRYGIAVDQPCAGEDVRPRGPLLSPDGDRRLAVAGSLKNRLAHSCRRSGFRSALSRLVEDRDCSHGPSGPAVRRLSLDPQIPMRLSRPKAVKRNKISQLSAAHLRGIWTQRLGDRCAEPSADRVDDRQRGSEENPEFQAAEPSSQIAIPRSLVLLPPCLSKSHHEESR